MQIEEINLMLGLGVKSHEFGLCIIKQESLAIAKMTARCALYIACPENFTRVPEYAHGYFSRNF